MQEEIEHKTVNLAISTTKLSARTDKVFSFCSIISLLEFDGDLLPGMGGVQQSCHKEAEKSAGFKNAKPIKKFSMAHLSRYRCRAVSGRLPSG